MAKRAAIDTKARKTSPRWCQNQEPTETHAGHPAAAPKASDVVNRPAEHRQ